MPESATTSQPTSTGIGETHCSTNRTAAARAIRNRPGWESKRTPRARQSPTCMDIFWAAGFYEGEGFACQTGVSEQLSAVQVNREPLERLQEFFGGSLRLRGARNSRSNPTWRWRICGSRARGFAMTIYSLLSRRRQEQLRKSGMFRRVYA